MTDKVQKIREWVKARLDENNSKQSIPQFYGMMEEDARFLDFLDTMQEEPVNKQNLSNVERTVKEWKEPVSEELMDATNNYCVNVRNGYPRVMDETDRYICNAFKAGAKWQKEHIWKSADGDDLPEYEREVVVFTQNFPDDAGIMCVAIGHRPTPEGYDGKSLTTGEVKHYIPKTYDKGGWNIPDIKWWLDVELPKEIEL